MPYCTEIKVMQCNNVIIKLFQVKNITNVKNEGYAVGRSGKLPKRGKMPPGLQI